MLAWFFFWVFLWHFPYWLQFYLGSFSYTSRAGFNFIWGVSLTHPVLALFVCGEFPLHIPCWLLFFSLRRNSPTHPVLTCFCFFSLLHIWLQFLSGEFLWRNPCWLQFYLGSFSYTSRAGFCFIWGVSLSHPVLASFVCEKFLLRILSWFNLYSGSFSYTSRAGFFFYLGSFSYTSHTWLIFLWGVSLTHPMLALISSGEFLLHIPCWLQFYLGSFSLTHPVLASILSGEFLLHIPFVCAEFLLHMLSWLHLYGGMFLLHIPCWLFFIFFIWWVSLSHPMLAWIFFREFLLHIPCCLHFELGSFSYASRAGFLFIFFSFTLSMLASFFNLGVSLTHLVLVSFLYEGSLSYISRAA